MKSARSLLEPAQIAVSIAPALVAQGGVGLQANGLVEVLERLGEARTLGMDDSAIVVGLGMVGLPAAELR